MNRSVALKIQLELFWWIFTALAVVFILFPIWRVFDHYPFLVPNLLFIIGFITYTRYTFLLKHTWLAKLKYVKGGLVFISVPVIFLTIEALHGLQVFIDEQGPEALFVSEYLREPLSPARQRSMLIYIRREFFITGIGLVVAAAAFPLRMLISIWRQINTDKV
ncbi:MAG: hypothetical protein AAF598_06940 [Bacteroidota bacterium]